MNPRIFSFTGSQNDASPPIVLPEAGRFSVGEWVDGSGNRSGHARSLEYFRVYRGEESVRVEFKKTYGDKPTELDVSFLSSDPGQSLYPNPRTKSGI